MNSSVRRLQHSTQEFLNQAIDFQRYEAVNGRNILIRNLSNDKEFTGAMLILGKMKIKKGNTYQITCNPVDENIVQFKYKGYSLNAGELGLYCSNYMIWTEMVQNKIPLAIVFEDDFKFMVSNFSAKLDLFMQALPDNFDLGWLNSDIKNNIHRPNNSPAISKQNLCFTGTKAILYSLKGAEKLVSTDYFSFPIDVFLGKASATSENEEQCKPGLNYGLLKGTDYHLSAYLAAPQLIGCENLGSEIHAMGHSVNH